MESRHVGFGDVVFHAGLPKAGSSAIQSFLKRNAEPLKAQGVLYEVFNPFPEGDETGIDSGNAYKLTQFAAGARTLSARASWRRYLSALRRDASMIALSSEVVCKLSPEALARLQAPVAAQGRRSRYVLCLRNLRDFYNSRYLQALKHGLGGGFDEWFEAKYGGEGMMLSAVRLLKDHVEARDDAELVLLDFDKHRDDLLQQFCAAAFGASASELRLDFTNNATNRSLSPEEALIFQKLSEADPEKCSKLFTLLAQRDQVSGPGPLPLNPSQIDAMKREADGLRALLPQGWSERTFDVESHRSRSEPNAETQRALKVATQIIAELMDENERSSTRQIVRNADGLRKAVKSRFYGLWRGPHIDDGQ